MSVNTYGMGKKTLSSYIIGLTLSVIFTLCSFATVTYHIFSTKNTFIVLAVLAIAQLIAQVVFFLRMNSSKDGMWNLMPFIFTRLFFHLSPPEGLCQFPFYYQGSKVCHHIE